MNFAFSSRTHRQFAIFFCLVLLVGILFVFMRSQTLSKNHNGLTQTATAESENKISPSKAAPSSQSPHKSVESAPQVVEPIPGGATALQKIQASASAIRRLYNQSLQQPADELAPLREAIHTQCEALKKLLLEMPDDIATDGILRYLFTNEDTPTNLPFDVGEDGPLNQAPTLRTLLLDILGQTGPDESVAFANEIFEKSASPDEWALALRNLGWHDLNGENRSTMLNRLKQMLGRSNWVESPSDGFLEALDISVYLGFESTGDLVAALVESRPQHLTAIPDATTDADTSPPHPVTHAATLALHRMAISDPSPLVTRLSSDSNYLQQAPGYRASLLARADIRDPLQAKAVTDYLSHTGVPMLEHLAFLTEFPNRNGILTNSLVSTLPPHLEFDQNVAIDRAALALVGQWIQDEVNPALKEALTASYDRLSQYVTAASIASHQPSTDLPSLDPPKVPARNPDSR